MTTAHRRTALLCAALALVAAGCRAAPGTAAAQDAVPPATAAPPTAAATPSAGATPTAGATDAPTPEATPSPGRPVDPGAAELVAALTTAPEPARTVALQTRLEELGYKPGPADGRAGPRTQGAVRAFQSGAGLDPTGAVDPPTAAALAAATPVPTLGPGATGPEVAELQTLLAIGPIDPGPADGTYGDATVHAVTTLQKLHGLTVDGIVGAPERRVLQAPPSAAPAVADGPGAGAGLHVELDLERQLITLWRGGRLELATHTSTGSGETFCTPAGGCRRAVTPRGTFTVSRRIDGWRNAELGRLYNPLYFNGGIAFHGALSVPLYPASHGCARVPMHIAEYLPGRIPNGTTVYVL